MSARLQRACPGCPKTLFFISCFGFLLLGPSNSFPGIHFTPLNHVSLLPLSLPPSLPLSVRPSTRWCHPWWRCQRTNPRQRRGRIRSSDKWTSIMTVRERGMRAESRFGLRDGPESSSSSVSIQASCPWRSSSKVPKATRPSCGYSSATPAQPPSSEALFFPSSLLFSSPPSCYGNSHSTNQCMMVLISFFWLLCSRMEECHCFYIFREREDPSHDRSAKMFSSLSLSLSLWNKIKWRCFYFGWAPPMCVSCIYCTSMYIIRRTRLAVLRSMASCCGSGRGLVETIVASL